MLQNVETLRESEEIFRSLFNLAAVGIAQIRPDGRWLRINKKLCDIVGYAEEELKKLSIQVLTHPDDMEAHLTLIHRVLQGKIENYSLEKRFLHKNGSIVWVNLTVSLLRNPAGEPKYLIAVVEDITARKLAEIAIELLNTQLAARAAELETANIELEAFNSSVSHDLRRPLGHINGYCQMLQQFCADRLDEQCSGYVRNIFEATLTMNSLIETLLKFSRILRVEMHLDAVDLSGLTQAVATSLVMAEPERRVTFRIAEGIKVNGDASLLEIALNNLIGNAWKFTGKQEEAVIEFGVTEVEGKPVYFVRDNGVGFDMSQAEKLFIPFQRLSGTGEYKGHGIGLATVERIIKRHGGRVWAESGPDKGTTFYFTLQTEKIAPSADV